MKKIALIIMLLTFSIMLYGCNTDKNSYATQYSKLNKYPRQTQELCEAGGAEYIQFSTGCRDECVYERWSGDDQYACTEALTHGCDCGLDKCWNGNSCEPN